MENILDKIREQLASHRYVLYMKGTPQAPQCGFSAKAVAILRRAGLHDFLAVDVLADEAIRQGIKTYSDWPTIPQFFINSEFVGGADILEELWEEGELERTLAKSST